MPFKINIGTKQGKTFKLEAEAPALIDKELGDKIQGEDVSPDLEGYEFEITGTSDKSGFTSIKDVEGIGLKKVLLTYGKAMKKRPRKEGKKKQLCKKPKGLRLRRTVRGKIISDAISQINLKLIKEGSKKLEEVFVEQNKREDEQKIDDAQLKAGSDENEGVNPSKEEKPAEEMKE